MRHIRKAQILGVWILTPALTGQPQAAAAAYSASDPLVEGVAPRYAAIWLLHEGVSELSPAEKLKIGGDRIRLSAAGTKTKTQKRQNVGPKGPGAQGPAARRSLSIAFCNTWRCTDNCTTHHPCTGGCGRSR
jgi:hypothetical protein